MNAPTSFTPKAQRRIACARCGAPFDCGGRRLLVRGRALPAADARESGRHLSLPRLPAREGANSPPHAGVNDKGRFFARGKYAHA